MIKLKSNKIDNLKFFEGFKPGRVLNIEDARGDFIFVYFDKICKNYLYININEEKWRDNKEFLSNLFEPAINKRKVIG